MTLDLSKAVNSKRIGQLIGLLFLTLITAFFEVVSIGSVIPFLAIMSNKELIVNNEYFIKVNELFPIQPEAVGVIFALAFGLAAVIAGGTRFLLLSSTTKLSFNIGADLGENIYKNILHMPYQAHLGMSSGEIISLITDKVGAAVGGVIFPTLTIISSAIILMSLSALLVSLANIDSMILFALFGLLYVCIYFLLRKILLNNGAIVNEMHGLVKKSIQEGIGGIRDVLLCGTQAVFVNEFTKVDTQLRSAQIKIHVAMQAPRYIVESFGLLFIAILAITYEVTDQSLIEIVPVLGALVLGLQRLLPIFQQIYISISAIIANRKSFQECITYVGDIDQLHNYATKVDRSSRLVFNKDIELRNLSFRYPNATKDTLANVNCIIRKGDRIGILGASGSGKSTFLDIIMGLLPPSSGELLVDGNKITKENALKWGHNISHVPQKIYLLDGSFEENIAFGVPTYLRNKEKIIEASKKANIYDLLVKEGGALRGYIGERGSKLSGGQIQRLGIARAIYGLSDLLILDEVTSALDPENSDRIVNLVSSLSKDITVIMVSHDASSMEWCDKVIYFNNGLIQEQQ